ncbi:MAG: glycosyltransferase family 2 protein [Acidobacteriota bacterium]
MDASAPDPRARRRLPRLSIVTPSFNQAEFLELTLRSILDQDYPNLELIVMDGGSTDGSAEILRAYGDRLSHWVSEPDGGQTDAINRGFARSSGDVLTWINSDDLLLPGSLEFVGRAFAEDPELHWLTGALRRIDAGGKTLDVRTAFDQPSHLAERGIFTNGARYRFNVPQPSSFFSRELWNAAGPLDRSVQYTMDRMLWLTAFARGFEPRFVERELAAFRLHEGSKTVSQKSAFTADRARVHWRLARRPGFRLLPNLQLAREYAVDLRLQRCDALLEAGSPARAAGALGAAMALSPGLIRRRLYSLREIASAFFSPRRRS